jgi:HD superfamily phosphohydrolase
MSGQSEKQEKLFQDVIHGYIKIPSSFVEQIIDTALFQRLRNIAQTGMGVLYPNARHDRFSHSLGVFHLGTLALEALEDELIGIYKKKVEKEADKEAEKKAEKEAKELFIRKKLSF